MAIALVDGQGLFSANGAGSTITVAVNCTGASVLWASVWAGAGNILTGVTYNGVAMTDYGGGVWVTGAGQAMYMYYMLNPTTGTNNVIATFNTAASQKTLVCSSWSGTSTTTAVNASSLTQSVSQGGSGTNGTPINGTVTSTVDNCVAILHSRSESGTYTASTNSTLISSPSTITADFYSAIKTPAGSINMQATYTGGATGWSAMMIVMPPPAAAGTIRTPYLNLLGVGS